MSPRTGADPGQLRALRGALAGHVHDLRDDVVRVQQRLRHHADVSREYVPPVAPHGPRGHGLVARLEELVRHVDGERERLLAADRWLGTSAARRVRDVELRRQAAVGGVRGADAVWAMVRRGELGTGRPVAEQLRARDTAWLRGQTLRGRGPDGTRWGVVADTRADIDRLRGRAVPPARPVTSATGGLGRARAAVANSRIGAVGRLGGTAVGAVGVVAGVAATVEGVRSNDTEQVVVGGIGTVAGVMVLSGFPPAQLAGAVVSGGLLVYEHRTAIARTGRRAADAMGAAIGALVDGLF